MRDSIAELVASSGLAAETFASLEIWQEKVRSERGGCLLLDADELDFAGEDRLARLAAVCATRPVLVLVDRGNVPVAVRAIRSGAVDVIEKPQRDDILLQTIARAASAP